MPSRFENSSPCIQVAITMLATNANELNGAIKLCAPKAKAPKSPTEPITMQNKPTRVNDAFGQLISDKVVDFLANKKQEISTRMFKSKEEIPAEVEVKSEPEAEAQTTEA